LWLVQQQQQPRQPNQLLSKGNHTYFETDNNDEDDESGDDDDDDDESEHHRQKRRRMNHDEIVVHVPEMKPTIPATAIATVHNSISSTANTNTNTTISPSTSASTGSKEERIQRWKMALGVNDKIDSHRSNDYDNDGKVKVRKNNDKNIVKDNESEFMFVIDRKGVKVDDDDNNNNDVDNDIDGTSSDCYTNHTNSKNPTKNENEKQHKEANNDDKDDEKQTNTKNDNDNGKEKQTQPQDNKDEKDDEKKDDFMFVIDHEGVKEFGGEATDIDHDINHKEKGGDNDDGDKESSKVRVVIEIEDDDDTDNNKNDTNENKKTITIEIDNSDDNNDDDNDDDDDDKTDKMNEYYNRVANDHEILHQRRRKNDNIIDLCASASSSSVCSSSSNSSKNCEVDDDNLSATTDPHDELKEFVRRFEGSDDDDDDGDNLQINCNISSIDRGAVARFNDGTSITTKIGKKKMAVKALRVLSNHFHKSSYASSVECRAHAKVPIICLTTRFGFDTDIAIGGNNGMDTSHYVRCQAEKNESFATVVLILKVLLQQTNLDKPFTGGLGSYKLYVLLAHHYEMHSSIGGGKSAAEILISFFFRYSDIYPRDDRLDPRTKTNISKSTKIYCDGGEASLDSNFKNGRFVQLFSVCYKRLINSLEEKSSGDNISLLTSIIDATQLQSSRQRCFQKAVQCTEMQRVNDRTYFPHDDPNKIAHGKRVGYTFSKSGVKSPRNDDISFKQLSRDSRGVLIPKWQPDVDAKPKGLNSVLLRGGKNRKNKKKQKRDMALKEFVTTHV